ncbi:uncharacterized protein [Elaeis guineensis]|uniref:Uncharacterized protein LOC105033059 n=1 Tax=Elaeis guineensis var. tenera TaxID=51953 RepID=A0A6J0PDA1_ELAGV|nr:uncharacterized protein LOC105033059 [Elaeis guineensis]
MTHMHRGGSFVQEESRELIDRAITLIAERISESSSSAECSSVEDQVFTKLMGPEHYGRIRDYGVGVIPTQLSAVSRYTQECRQNNSTAEVHRLETQIQEMSQRHYLQIEELRRSYQTEIVSLRTQMDQITSFLCGFASHQGPNTFSSR